MYDPVREDESTIISYEYLKVSKPNGMINSNYHITRDQYDIIPVIWMKIVFTIAPTINPKTKS